jgi:hypothetical protein
LAKYLIIGDFGGIDLVVVGVHIGLEGLHVKGLLMRLKEFGLYVSQFFGCQDLLLFIVHEH